MGVRLEDLTPGALAGGIVADAIVTVVAVRWIGSNALQLTFHTENGRLDERLLYRDHEPRLTLRQAAAAYDFSADGALFKLAAEALRIRMAARFDPMLAVHTSDLASQFFQPAQQRDLVLQFRGGLRGGRGVGDLGLQLLLLPARQVVQLIQVIRQIPAQQTRQTLPQAPLCRGLPARGRHLAAAAFEAVPPAFQRLQDRLWAESGRVPGGQVRNLTENARTLKFATYRFEDN